MSEVAILIASCDAFADVHGPALECLSRYWPDKPSDWQLYTTSNSKPWGSLPILTGGLNAGWSANLLNALDHLKVTFVCLFLDDMLLCRPVDTAACLKVHKVMQAFPDIGAFRLGQGAETLDDPILAAGMEECEMKAVGFKVALDSDYRVSTSPTLWRVAYLRKILEHVGPTAWDFEVQGTEFSRSQPEEIWVQHPDDTKRAIRTYYTAITRGRWNRGCLDWLRQLGIDVGTLQRGVIENGN